MRVYLDNAASTPLDPQVLKSMQECLEVNYGNPSSTHAEGRKARTIIEDARKRIAKHLNCSVGEIFFTSGGTESNNTAIKCAVRDLGVTQIITSPIEHHCVLHSVERMEKENIKVDLIKVDDCGNFDLNHLEELLSSSTEKKLVTLMHANNEIGTISNLEKIAEICTKYNAYLHSDTVQTTGHIPIDLSKIKIDFISGSAHKFHGPKGVGFLYINGDTKIGNFIDGGGQERNIRGGTENLGGIAGMALAFDLACDEMENRRLYIDELRTYFKEKLTQTIPGVSFNGNQDNYLYTVLNVAFPKNEKSDLLLLHLDIAGISASGGSACSSGTDTGSHVIRSIGKNENNKSVRFSFSHYNTKEEIDFVVEKLQALFS